MQPRYPKAQGKLSITNFVFLPLRSQSEMYVFICWKFFQLYPYEDTVIAA